MSLYEYTVIPAANRGEKAKGARTGIERFAHALTGQINDMAAKGWEYVRAETLPCEERAGLTGRNTIYHNVLVFRRGLENARTAIDPTAARPAAAPTAPPAIAPAATAEGEAQSAPPAVPPDLHGGPQVQAREDDPVEPHDPPASWPDGPSPTVQSERPRVPERVPADAAPDATDDAEDALILDDDAPERPQFGDPMPKVTPPNPGSANR